MCPNHQDMMRQIILSVTTLGLSSMVLGQSIEVVLFQETGLEEATQTALTNYAEQTGVEMTFYEEVLDYSADPGNIQPCAVMDSILSQKDVAIFLGGTKPQHCNWADIVPQLHQFVQGGGTLIFQGPIADGGMAFFFEPDQWEQFDDDPWFGDIDDSQHWCCGLGVENANCGGGQELFGVSHTDHPIFSGAYNYPDEQQGVCDIMIFEPSWYTLGAADLNDPRFFSILEFGQALNTGWVHEGEDTQMIFGKSLGAGHVVFYGENNPLPNPYTGSQTLLGNMVIYFSMESGCTDENACNYDPEANVDDGSCAQLDACGECGGVAGCNDASACNFDSAATCDDGSCDYCSCVGEVVFGANFDDVLIQYGANELFTTDEDLDLSSIEGQRILDVEGGEGYFIVMNEDSTLTTLCEGCLYGNPPPSTWKVLDVEVGRHEGCLVRVDGSLHSFGANYLGLQNEPTVDNAIQCAASWNFHMALLDDGEIVGWGNGWDACPLPLSDVVEIDAGGGHAVALMENGTLVEWGRLDDGSVAHSQEWILDLEQVVHVVAGQNSTWMFFADGSAKLVEFPSGEVWLELPAGSGVVDGDRNWAVTSYLKNDGGVYIQQNSGTSEVELDLSAHENCGTCVLDSDEDGTCNLDEVFGCADEAGCNYAGEATQNAGCVYPILPEADCSAGSVICGEGTVWDTATQTCLSAPSEQGPCLDGTVWDEDLQGCIVANPSDTDFDGCVSMTDLLDLLSVFGTCNEIPWSCGDPLGYQGYDYETVQIGEQCWFAENLRSENYENGDLIPANLNDSEWENASSGAVAIFGEGEGGCFEVSIDGDACDEAWSLHEYGRLYNWFAVDDTRGLCPSDWHVPSNEEWTTMTEYLGGASVAGGDLRASYGWPENGNGSNLSGFSGLPGGYRYWTGSFSDAGNFGSWWSSTPAGSSAWFRYLLPASPQVNGPAWDKRYGYSVRCIQDPE